MKGSKITATLVVLAMVLSTLVVLFNNPKVEAIQAGLILPKKTPGVDVWQGSTYSAPVSKTKILNMTNPDLRAHTTRDLSFNGTLITQDCWLYKPVYHSQGGPNYYVWVNWSEVTATKIDNGVAVPTLNSIYLNTSGFWFIAPVDVPMLWKVNMSNMSAYSAASGVGIWKSIVGWFWVNSSAWQISVTPSTTYYDQNVSVTVNVKNTTAPETLSDTKGFIDMWKIENSHYSLIYHKYQSDMSAGWTLTSANMYDYTHLKGAGVYAFSAYAVPSSKTYDYAERIYGSDGGASNNLNYGWNVTFGNESYWARFQVNTTKTKILDWQANNINNGAHIRWKDATYRYHNNDTLGCGPFAPPEYWSDYANFTIQTGQETLSVGAANRTQYWSFNGEINISIKKYDTKNLTTPYKVYIFNENGTSGTVCNMTKWFNNATVSHNGWIRKRDGYCLVNSSSWGKISTNNTIYGRNGTWTVVIVKNSANATSTGNATYEWNYTVTFEITQAPASQFKWINDDGGTAGSGTRNDGVISNVPSRNGVAGGVSQALDIQFQIINRNHLYFGAASAAELAQAKGNITLSGDALYLSSSPMALKNYPGNYELVGGTTWHVWLTPTMATNGGHITIAYDWEDFNSGSQALQIGGSLTAANGSIVSVLPNEFTVGDNQTFKVTVTDPATGNPINNAYVSLYWLNDSAATTANSAGNISGLLTFKDIKTTNGEYTLRLNTSQETNNQTTSGSFGTVLAPRNISVYVNAPNFGYGYALIKMNPKHQFKVTMEPSTVMAGQYLTHVWFNTTKVGSDGNETGHPPDAGVKVRIYNSTGSDVTTTIGSISLATTLDGNDNLSLTGLWFNEPGVYTVYAHNNTWDSRGYNATLTVQAVDVTCDLSEFILQVDQNKTATFTVKYNGQLVNGSLRIDNVTHNGTYNGTWWLTNFTPTVHTTGGIDAENTSIEVTVVNGVVTVHNITVQRLPGTVAKKNITFYFKPSTSGSAWAHTNGVVPVKIATVAVSPNTIPYNKGSQITISVTGRGTALERVWTSIVGAGVTQQIGNTSSDGTVTFWVVPTSTGYISVTIQNRTSDTKVRVTAWSLYIDAPLQANENGPFTVTIRNETDSGAGIVNVAVQFNGETKTTGSNGQVTFTAPTVSGDRIYDIYATAVGYAEDTETIQVINIPQLIIAISGTVKTGQSFTAVVADDSGGAVIGATVTFEGTTYTTGAGGVVTLTAPGTAGSYPISATFGTFAAASSTVTVVKGGGVPGFELLTLIAAIGVAFLLLRRRRN